MDRVDDAFQAMDRADFLPAQVRRLAHFDTALPIGHGQTNSQPYTVGLMLRWLDPQPGDKVLDVGSGSGWTTALLSHLVGESGKVYAVEIEPHLLKYGAENCRRLGVGNVSFHKAGASFGLPRYAPYDRILVSASAAEVPQALLDQLAEGGRAVIPVGTTILVIDRVGEADYVTAEHPGFLFVPLV